MLITFEIREQIETTNGNRMETTQTYPDYAERTARLNFKEFVSRFPGRYFELIRVERSETCLLFVSSDQLNNVTSETKNRTQVALCSAGVSC